MPKGSDTYLDNIFNSHVPTYCQIRMNLLTICIFRNKKKNLLTKK